MTSHLMRLGGHLLRSAGHLTNSLSCCCGGEPVCCTFDPARELYLTIDQFSFDGGENSSSSGGAGGCDGCVDFGTTAKVNFGGAQSSANSVNWFTGACGDDGSSILAYTLLCNDGTYGPVGTYRLNMFSSGSSWIVDNCTDNNKLCVIRLSTTGGTGSSGSDQPLGVAVCSPFYLQATVNVTIYEADGTTECGTGTMRVTITE